MQTDTQNLYLKVKDNHAELYRLLKTQRGKVETCNDIKELADIAYAMRETYKLADDFRKFVNTTKELAEKIACIIWIKNANVENIKTDHCTATPQIKQIGTLPKRGTDEHSALMDFLKVPKELYENEELFRVYWPGFQEWLSRKLSEGLPLPPGLDVGKTYPRYSLSIRQRKGVDE